MKKQVFFIHGGDAFTNRNDFLEYLRVRPVRNLPDSQSTELWTKNLVEDLGEEYEVFMPSMPNSQNADYAEWCIWFERHFVYLRNEVILIGWSLGGMFLAKYLAEKQLPFIPARVFLLAAPCKTCDCSDGNDCGTFQFDQNSLERLAKIPVPIEIWHSEDDFVVPFSAALAYAKVLPKAKSVYFKDKTHFLVPILPELLSAIKAIGAK